MNDGKAQYSLVELTLYTLNLGTTGFGGPVALVGYMYRDLVERRKWYTEEEYKQGLSLAQLAPGPLAAQLAIYLGYVHYGILGATLVGGAFVLPSFIMVVILGWLYRHYGGLAWMHAAFYGVGAVVIGIIAISAHKLAMRTLAKNRLLWGVAIFSALWTAISQSEQIWVILAGGALVWIVQSPGALSRVGLRTNCFFLPMLGDSTGMIATAQNTGLLSILLFFAKAGTCVFGSGLAIVPFLYGGVVTENHWLTDQEFVDAVAVAMITPGPVVITVGFIGYLVAGFGGACMAAMGTFLPCYLFTILLAPYFKKHGKQPGIASFVNGVTAAAVGAIAGSVVVLGQRSVVDGITAIIAVSTALVLWKYKKVPEPILILVGAVIGILLR